MSDCDCNDSPVVRMLLGDVGPEAVAQLQWCIDKCLAEGQPILPISILSPGGDVHSMSAMIDLIDSSRIQVATIALGMAASAAAVILACGSPGQRYVAPGARVLVHEMLASIPFASAPDVVADAECVASMNQGFLEELDSRTGHRKGYWIKKIRGKPYRDLTMRAEDAVREGLADRVGVPLVGTHREEAVVLIEPEKKAVAKRRR